MDDLQFLLHAPDGHPLFVRGIPEALNLVAAGAEGRVCGSLEAQDLVD
jgi:hypothetical protein